MIPGYDCPYEAVYLPATNYASMGSIVREHAVCIFEYDTARPITRHTGYHDGEFGAVRGYTLVVRSVSTVGKYVYIRIILLGYPTNFRWSTAMIIVSLRTTHV